MTWTRGESDGEEKWMTFVIDVCLLVISIGDIKSFYIISSHSMLKQWLMLKKSKCFKTLCGFLLKRAFLTQLLLLVQQNLV
jgi:hypothetical protein